MSTSAHICIIDDDAELSGLLKKRLCDYGFSVSHFPTGEAFFAPSELPAFDLIILDVMLPGEDGLSICRRLRGLCILYSLLSRRLLGCLLSRRLLCCRPDR